MAETILKAAGPLPSPKTSQRLKPHLGFPLKFAKELLGMNFDFVPMEERLGLVHQHVGPTGGLTWISALSFTFGRSSGPGKVS